MELARRALSNKLTKEEETVLIEALKVNPGLAFEWSFTADTMPALATYCSDVAATVLIVLNAYTVVAEYLSYVILDTTIRCS